MDYMREVFSHETLNTLSNNIKDMSSSFDHLKQHIHSYIQIQEPTFWELCQEKMQSAFDWILPYAVTFYWYIFFFLLITATVGRKLKLRRFYINILDRIFDIASIKLREENAKAKRRKRLLRARYEIHSSGSEDDEETAQQRLLDDVLPGKRRISRSRKDYYQLQAERQAQDGAYSSSAEMSSKSLQSSWEDLTTNRGADKVQQLLNHFNSPAKTECEAKESQVISKMKTNSSLNYNYCASCSEINNCVCQNVVCQNVSLNGNTSGMEGDGEEITSAESSKLPTRKVSDSSGNEDLPLNGEIRRFPLDAPLLYIAAGIRAILDDCVQKSFSPEQLDTWNLLSRTIDDKKKIGKNKNLAIFFICGFIVRYVFLMPMRVLVLVLSLSNLAFWTFLVGCLPDGPFKRMVNSYVVSWGFDFVAGSLSVVTRFHNKENRPSHGIAVANHTSPIDGMLLATDNCYDMVGQKTKGLLGMFMNALSKSSSHIWFERSDARDRSATTRRLAEHARDMDLPPILIFPEGVCVNNTAVLEFRKGAFEVDCDIFPVAVRFDPVYGDAFWYEGGFATYCFSMMTSWAIVCDIYYMPPMRRRPEESASLFASRVRSCIAQKAGLQELQWSSLVKPCVASPDKWDKLKSQKQEEKQKEFVRKLSLVENTTNTNEGSL